MFGNPYEPLHPDFNYTIFWAKSQVNNKKSSLPNMGKRSAWIIFADYTKRKSEVLKKWRNFSARVL